MHHRACTSLGLGRSLGLGFSLLVAGCGGGDDPADAGGGMADAFVPEGTDASVPARFDAYVPEGTDAALHEGDTGGPGTDASIACTPTAGPATSEGSCDFFHLAVLRHGSAAEVQLYGRLRPDGAGAADGCTVVDEVEVLEGDTSLGTIAGVGAFETGTPDALLARGPALDSMRAHCLTDEGRFETYGLIVRGRYDGGSFEARCARAEGATHWPPALRMTCHENLDVPPLRGNLTLPMLGGSVTTQVQFTVPHAPGAAITAITGDVRVMSHVSSIPPTPPATAPYSVPDLTGHVVEGATGTLGPNTIVNMFASRDVLGTTLCPSVPSPPSPGDPLPPSLIMRVGGVSERGPFSTEVAFDLCTRGGF